MKYLKLKYLCTAVDETPLGAFERYSHHLEQLQGILPARVLELATLPGVDDGLVVQVKHDRARALLTLVLRCGDLQMGYYDLRLIYEGASITPADEHTLARLARRTKCPYDGPDVAYHELDAAPEGGIEHRLLFHRGYEFSIRCRALRWEQVSLPDRRLPPRRHRFSHGPFPPPAEND